MSRRGILLLMLILLVQPVQSDHATDESDLELNGDLQYRLEIIAYDFNYTLFDMNKVDRLTLEGMDLSTARNLSKFNHEINGLEPGRPLEITAKSAGATHGLLIDELGVEFVLEAPASNQTYGTKMSQTSDLPSVDTTINAYCNIYCGVGHNEMQFKIRVGEGRDLEGQPLNVLGDWRTWVLFGMFGAATAGIIIIAIAKPRWIFARDDEL